MNKTRIGKYVDLELKERRSAVDVYLGIDPRTKQKVNITLLPEQFSENDKAREFFLDTAAALVELQHSHIVPAYSYGIEAGAPFIVMAHSGSVTLETIINRYKKTPAKVMPFSEAVSIFDKVASALEYAHDSGLFHEDVRPANIIMSENGDPVLTGFGIIHILDQIPSLSLTDGIYGAPPYISPERIAGKPVDKRCDMYALGVIAYQMVTGDVPFSGDMVSVFMQHMNKAPQNPKLLNATLPDSAANVILNALAKDPDARFASAAALATAFRQSFS